MRVHTLIFTTALWGLAACRGPVGAPPAEAPPAATLISQAGKLDLAGQHEPAIALYRQVLDREPDSYSAHYGLARALDLAGHYDEAREHFAKAIAIAPDADKDQALRMMAIAWTFVGNLDQASVCFRHVFDRRLAQSSFAGAADVANELGRLYLETGHLDEAQRWYRTGYDTALREPGQAAWQVDLASLRWAHAQARIAARRGRARDAHRQEALVKKLIDKGGNDDQRIQYPYLLGYDAFYLGDYRTAATELARADQKDPFILLLLAEVTNKLGDEGASRAYARRVLESTSHAINNALARPIAAQMLQQNSAGPRETPAVH